MEQTDPTDPIDSTDSLEQMLKTLLRERIDQREGMDRSCRAIERLWQTGAVHRTIIIIG